MAKQTYYLLQKDGIIRAYMWHYYLRLISLLSDSFNRVKEHKEF